MTKTASEQLKEKLIDLKQESTAKQTFSISDFESEARKVRDTFKKTDEHEHIQPRKALSL
ncbi:MAG: hypothetical protein ACREHC_00735 [Candidatus Levyibacteriota bacterium]